MHQCSQVPGCDPIILAVSKNENKSNQHDANNMSRIIHEYQSRAFQLRRMNALNSDSYVLETMLWREQKQKNLRIDGNTFIENETASYALC